MVLSMKEVPPLMSSTWTGVVDIPEGTAPHSISTWPPAPDSHSLNEYTYVYEATVCTALLVLRLSFVAVFVFMVFLDAWFLKKAECIYLFIYLF